MSSNKDLGAETRKSKGKEQGKQKQQEACQTQRVLVVGEAQYKTKGSRAEGPASQNPQWSVCKVQTAAKGLSEERFPLKTKPPKIRRTLKKEKAHGLEMS